MEAMRVGRSADARHAGCSGWSIPRAVRRLGSLSKQVFPAEADDLVLQPVDSSSNLDKAPVGVYQIRAGHTNDCMTVQYNSQNNGAPIVQHECVYGARNQWFHVTNLNGSLKSFRGYNSGKCFTIRSGSYSNGAILEQRSCLNQTNQRFYWSTDGPIRAYHSGKCVDVLEARTSNNAPIAQYTCNGRSNQSWWDSNWNWK